MKVQVINDSKGKPSGVFIPIKDWEVLKKQNKQLQQLENEEPSQVQLISELKAALVELKNIEQGKSKSRPAKMLLNEL